MSSVWLPFLMVKFPSLPDEWISYEAHGIGPLLTQVSIFRVDHMDDHGTLKSEREVEKLWVHWVSIVHGTRYRMEYLNWIDARHLLVTLATQGILP
jgi:hypothetical protein